LSPYNFNIKSDCLTAETVALGSGSLVKSPLSV
jgi:hypothetical protein